MEHGRWFFCASVSFVLVSFIIMQLSHKGAGMGIRWVSKDIRLFIKWVGAGLIFLLPLLPEAMPPYGLFLIVAFIIFVLVMLDMLGRQIRKRKPTRESTDAAISQIIDGHVLDALLPNAAIDEIQAAK